MQGGHVFRRVACWMAVLLLVSGLPAVGQEIGGVELGFTTIDQVREIRGVPDQEGLVDDGFAYMLSYDRHAFYFAGGDSVAIAARVAPEDMTRSEVEEIFGEPRETSRSADLSIRAVYADTLAVLYDREGETVEYLEYGMSDETVRLSRLRRRVVEYADSLQRAEQAKSDSIEKARLEQAHQLVDERVAKICKTGEEVPSLNEWNEMFDDLREHAWGYISQYRSMLLEDKERACSQVLSALASDST